jgi:hypothetical protein
LTEAALVAAADADLARFSTGAPELRFGSRDDYFVPGALAPINMPPPTGVVGDYLVQEVVMADFLDLHIRPLRQVVVAVARFTLNDFLETL